MVGEFLGPGHFDEGSHARAVLPEGGSGVVGSAGAQGVVVRPHNEAVLEELPGGHSYHVAAGHLFLPQLCREALQLSFQTNFLELRNDMLSRVQPGFSVRGVAVARVARGSEHIEVILHHLGELLHIKYRVLALAAMGCAAAACCEHERAHQHLA